MMFDFNEYIDTSDSNENYESKIQGSEEVQIENEAPQYAKDIDFNFNKYIDLENESWAEWTARQGVRSASRIGETALGLPGDIVSLVQWIDSKLPQPPKFLKGEDQNFLMKKTKNILINLPTSTELKEKMSEWTGTYTDPKNAGEEFADGVIELATALSFGKDPLKMKNLLKSIGKSFAAKGTSKTIEKFGGSKKAQLGGELGTLFLTGLLDQRLANEFVSNKFKKAKSLIPEKTMIPSTRLTQNLEALEKDLSRGISTPTKKEVMNSISELKGKTSGGSFPARDLEETYRNINEIMNSKKLFGELSSSEKKILKMRMDKLKTLVGDELRDYGKYNPEFLKEWGEANLGFKTIQDSKNVSSFIEGNIGKLPPKIVGSMAIELFYGYPEAAVGTAAAFSGLKAGELLYRVSKNTSLSKHYLDVIKHANAENLPAMINSLSKLDEGLKKSVSSPEER